MSGKTLRDVMRVLESYMPREQIKLVLRDLARIDGGKSFRDTVEALRKEYAEWPKPRRKLKTSRQPPRKGRGRDED